MRGARGEGAESGERARCGTHGAGDNNEREVSVSEVHRGYAVVSVELCARGDGDCVGSQRESVCEGEGGSGECAQLGGAPAPA